MSQNQYVVCFTDALGQIFVGIRKYDDQKWKYVADNEYKELFGFTIDEIENLPGQQYDDICLFLTNKCPNICFEYQTLDRKF